MILKIILIIFILILASYGCFLLIKEVIRTVEFIKETENKLKMYKRIIKSKN
jgi:hypothetical protein